MDKNILLTSAHVRAARGLLNWTQSELANECGLTKATIANIENNKHHLTSKSAGKILRAFLNAKVEFIGNLGVKVKEDVIKILEHKIGFQTLLSEMYNSVAKNGGLIRASGIDERLLQQILDPEVIDMHVNRMEKVPNLDFRVLINEEDYNPLGRNYANYRAVPSKYFVPIPIYIYDNKIAYITYNPIKVFIIENLDLYRAHFNQFDFMWAAAESLI